MMKPIKSIFAFALIFSLSFDAENPVENSLQEMYVHNYFNRDYNRNNPYPIVLHLGTFTIGECEAGVVINDKEESLIEKITLNDSYFTRLTCSLFGL